MSGNDLPTEQKRLRSAVESGAVAAEDEERIGELCDAYDEDCLTTPTPSGESSRAKNTLVAWCERLTTVAKAADKPLSSLTSAEANELMERLYEETDRGKSTVRNFQFSLRSFARHHEEIPLDADTIAAYDAQGNGYDPDDVLDADDIEAVKSACSNPRDSVIFHLLLYTGVRREGLRTLRVRDVKPDEGPSGRYRLNPEAEGLKGAASGEWRPLLGAQGAVREWLRYHPDPEPDNYLITAQPNYPRVDPTEPVSGETIRHVTSDKLAEEAGLDTLNPHLFRHTFVTIAKRDYEMDDSTIKRMLGHAPESDVMNTTYAHLSDEDYNQRAEEAAGFREPEEQKRMTPMSCGTCGHSLAPDSAACSNCGAVFSPEAQAVEQEVQGDVKDAYAQTDPEDGETQEKLDALDDLLDDPEIKQALLERVGAE